MIIFLLVLIFFCTCLDSGHGNITGLDPSPGATLCFDMQYLLIPYFSTDCNFGVTIINTGSCMVYTGKKQHCLVLDSDLELFQIYIGKDQVLISGMYLVLEGAALDTQSSGEGTENQDSVTANKRLATTVFGGHLYNQTSSPRKTETVAPTKSTIQPYTTILSTLINKLITTINIGIQNSSKSNTSNHVTESNGLSATNIVHNDYTTIKFNETFSSEWKNRSKGSGSNGSMTDLGTGQAITKAVQEANQTNLIKEINFNQSMLTDANQTIMTTIKVEPKDVEFNQTIILEYTTQAVKFQDVGSNVTHTSHEDGKNQTRKPIDVGFNQTELFEDIKNQTIFPKDVGLNETSFVVDGKNQTIMPKEIGINGTKSLEESLNITINPKEISLNQTALFNESNSQTINKGKNLTVTPKDIGFNETTIKPKEVGLNETTFIDEGKNQTIIPKKAGLSQKLFFDEGKNQTIIPKGVGLNGTITFAMNINVTVRPKQVGFHQTRSLNIGNNVTVIPEEVGLNGTNLSAEKAKNLTTPKEIGVGFNKTILFEVDNNGTLVPKEIGSNATNLSTEQGKNQTIRFNEEGKNQTIRPKEAGLNHTSLSEEGITIKPTVFNSNVTNLSNAEVKNHTITIRSIGANKIHMTIVKLKNQTVFNNETDTNTTAAFGQADFIEIEVGENEEGGKRNKNLNVTSQPLSFESTDYNSSTNLDRVRNWLLESGLSKFETIVITQTETRTCFDINSCALIIKEQQSLGLVYNDVFIAPFGFIFNIWQEYDGYSTPDISSSNSTDAGGDNDKTNVTRIVPDNSTNWNTNNSYYDYEYYGFNGGQSMPVFEATTLFVSLVGNYTTATPPTQLVDQFWKLIEMGVSKDLISKDYKIASICRQDCNGTCIGWALYKPFTNLPQFSFNENLKCNYQR